MFPDNFPMRKVFLRPIKVVMKITPRYMVPDRKKKAAVNELFQKKYFCLKDPYFFQSFELSSDTSSKA